MKKLIAVISCLVAALAFGQFVPPVSSGSSSTGAQAPVSTTTPFIDAGVVTVSGPLRAQLITAPFVDAGVIAATYLQAGGIDAGSVLASGLVSSGAISAQLLTTPFIDAGVIASTYEEVGGLDAGPILASGLVSSGALRAQLITTPFLDAGVLVVSGQAQFAFIDAGQISTPFIQAAGIDAGIIFSSANISAGTFLAAATTLQLPGVSDGLFNNAGFLQLRSTNGYAYSKYGTGTGVGALSSVLDAQFTPVGNTGDTNEDTLMTYTLPGNSLTTNGWSVRLTAFGTGVNTANATTLKCYFGGTVTDTLILTASQANVWKVVYDVVRVDATHQTAFGVITQGGTTTVTKAENTAPAETLSGNVVMKCTGQRGTSSTANSVVQLAEIVEGLHP